MEMKELDWEKLAQVAGGKRDGPDVFAEYMESVFLKILKEKKEKGATLEDVKKELTNPREPENTRQLHEYVQHKWDTL